jgi:hypothetical protein
LLGTATILSSWATLATALPVAQLDIPGATFDPVTETVITTSPTFTLYAYGNTPTGNGTPVNQTLNWHLSVAIDPQTTAGTNFGSFVMNGVTYDSSDFLYGVPPMETLLSFQGQDLSQHSVYPTLFMEFNVTWLASQTRAGVNVQTNPGTSPLANPGTGLYWLGWNFDVSGLLPGFNLHFDLYGTVCHATTTGQNCVVRQFAPFSHDAGTSVPEPATVTLLGAGLLLLGVATRRRRRDSAEA